LLDFIHIALKFRDDRPLDTNVGRPIDQIRNQVGLPAWGGGLLDNYGLHSVLELTSSYYAYPIAAFARIVAEDPALQARYECKIIPLEPRIDVTVKCSDIIFYANSILQTVEVFLRQIQQHSVGNGVEAMLTNPKEYHVRPTKDDCKDAKHQALAKEPGRKDRWKDEYRYCKENQPLAEKPMPHNINLLFSMVLIELSRVLASPFYQQSPRRASNAATLQDFFFVLISRQQRYFVNHLNPESLRDIDACKNNNFCWYYDDHGVDGIPHDSEDTDHGSMDMTYMRPFFRDIDRLSAAAERFNERFSLGFDQLQGFARTFVNTIAANTDVTGKNFKHNVTGATENNPENSNSRCEGWLELTRADWRVWNLCNYMSLRSVDGQQPWLNVANHSALLANKQFLP
jgi:hypothetical protein